MLWRNHLNNTVLAYFVKGPEFKPSTANKYSLNCTIYVIQQVGTTLQSSFLAICSS